MSEFTFFSSTLLRRISLGLAATSMAIASPIAAQGDLLVAPTRVIISGGGTSEVILSNIGSKAATYRIGLELRRMLPDGDLDDVEVANANVTEQAALGMIRYAPRRITLAPGAPQSVRISARPGADLPDGEYRVHMSFRSIPDAVPVEESAAADPNKGFQIRLLPVYGVTIPVIIRKGQLEAAATIANPQLVREGAATFLKLDLGRKGARSLYGELAVIARGVKEPVFIARGIAVYPELEARTVEFQVSAEQAAKLKGPLRFEYREMPENGGKLIAAIDSSIG